MIIAGMLTEAFYKAGDEQNAMTMAKAFLIEARRPQFLSHVSAMPLFAFSAVNVLLQMKHIEMAEELLSLLHPFQRTRKPFLRLLPAFDKQLWQAKRELHVETDRNMESLRLIAASLVSRGSITPPLLQHPDIASIGSTSGRGSFSLHSEGSESDGQEY